jgi:hypothetical protein
LGDFVPKLWTWHVRCDGMSVAEDGTMVHGNRDCFGLARAVMVALTGAGLGGCGEVSPTDTDSVGGTAASVGGQAAGGTTGGANTGGSPDTTGGTAASVGGDGAGGGANTGGSDPETTGGTAASIGGGGAGGGAGNSHIWTADSVRIELSCGKIGSAGGAPCAGSWGADAALLTPEQLGIIQQMTLLTPVYPQSTCDGGGYVIRVTDRSGTVRQYWEGQFISNCQEASWYGPELSGHFASALAATITWCRELAPNFAHATALEVDRCVMGYASPPPSAGSSLWARFTLPADESATVSATDGNRGGTANPRVALRLYDGMLLYDSSATTVFAESASGASLAVTEPGDYLVEVRSVTDVGSQVALELARAGGGSGGSGGSGPGTGGSGGAGGSAIVTPAIWSADSARIELACGSVGSATPSCQGSWVADAAQLTAEQLDLISRMTVLPVESGYNTCYGPGYTITVTDRSGKSRVYWGGSSEHCIYVPYPELAADLVQALGATITWCGGTFALAAGQATTVQAGQCLTGYASTGSSLWARFRLPAGASYTVTAMDGNEGGSINANVAPRLYDSTGTTVLAETQPGASLTVSEPGDYVLEVRNVTGVGCQVALEVVGG